MSDSMNGSEAEHIVLVEPEVSKLSDHLESIGLDVVKEGAGETIEAMLVVARNHTDEREKAEYGAALLGLWTSLRLCHGLLAEMSDDTPDVVH